MLAEKQRGQGQESLGGKPVGGWGRARVGWAVRHRRSLRNSGIRKDVTVTGRNGIVAGRKGTASNLV